MFRLPVADPSPAPTPRMGAPDPRTGTPWWDGDPHTAGAERSPHGEAPGAVHLPPEANPGDLPAGCTLRWFPEPAPVEYRPWAQRPWTDTPWLDDVWRYGVVPVRSQHRPQTARTWRLRRSAW